MLKCPQCGADNFPFTDSGISVEGTIHGGFDSPGGVVSGGGTAVQLVEFCQFCGGRVFERCPVCKNLHWGHPTLCPKTGINVREFLAEKSANEEEYRKRQSELQRQQSEKETKEKETEERIRREFREAYQACWMERRNSIRAILLSAIGFAVFLGFLGWPHLHSLWLRILMIPFLICLLGGVAMFIEFQYVKRPAKIRAWGPPPWDELRKWLI